MWKQRVIRLLGAGLFVCSLAVTGVTVVTVASVEAFEPPCPSKCDDRMGCAGSLCNCLQTSMGSGEWACFQPDPLPD